jgi:hypothetical protein
LRHNQNLRTTNPPDKWQKWCVSAKKREAGCDTFKKLKLLAKESMPVELKADERILY